MKVYIQCPEGWSYITWQRILVLDERGASVAKELAEKFNNTRDYDPDSPVWVGSLPGDPAECLFVESGESYTAADFVAQVKDLMGWDVVFSDANDPDEEVSVENGSR